MAVLLDKLSKRGVERFGSPVNQPKSPLPSITDQINLPTVKTVNKRPLNQRINNVSQRGAVGSLPQNANIKKRFVADLPSNEQLEGIQSILSGKDTNSPIINNFVKGMAAQGKSAEEIRQAFVEQQKQSNNPLVIL